MSYGIQIDRESGDNQVKVLKEIAENTYSLYWAFTLKGDNKRISLLEKLNEDCFIVANRNAWVRIYNISKKALIFEKNYNGNSSSITLVSKDKTKLYISYATDNYEAFIEIISLVDFSIIKTIELPEDFDNEHFTLGTNNQLMFYYTDDYPYIHGYNIVNEETGKIENFPMEYPQLKSFEIKPPAISPESNLGILPFWDKMEIKKDKNNKPLFVFKVMLFNLTNFKVEKVISAREYPTQQLNEDYYTPCEEYAKLFQTKNYEDKDYQEAVEDFMENLNSIVFDEALDSFWLCFRGGIVRKITFDGKLSPLFVTTSMFSSAGKENFDFKDFHSSIATINQNGVILTDAGSGYGYGDYTMFLSADELLSNEPLIEKELTKKEEEPIKIITSEKDKLALEEANKVIIKVADLNQEKHYLKALDKMIVLTQDIEAIKNGNLLIFRIKDKVKFEEDAVFFKKAIKVAGAAKKMEQIITNFIKYKEVNYLYIDNETTALAYTVYHLVASDAKYIDTVMRYLRVIDYEHDVFNRESLIPLLKEKYSKEYGSQIKKNYRK